MTRTLLVVLTVFATIGSTAVSAQSIEGVWSLEEQQVLTGPDAGTTTGRPGLLIFTEGYYSMALETSPEPRPLLSESPTDAERGQVFSPYVSSSGTYEFDGTTLKLGPTVNKDPGMVAGVAEQSREVVELTAETLRYATVINGERVRVITYTRVE